MSPSVERGGCHPRAVGHLQKGVGAGHKSYQVVPAETGRTAVSVAGLKLNNDRETVRDNWSEFWEDAGEERRTKTAPAAQFTLDPLRSFVEAKGVPGSVADVGCGPGTVPFAMAEQFPEATVVGYDAAEPVLAENRDRAEREGHTNLAFEQTVLPSFDPDRSFELVTR